MAEAKATKLVEHDHVDVIFGGIYSSTRQAIKGPAVVKARSSTSTRNSTRDRSPTFHESGFAERGGCLVCTYFDENFLNLVPAAHVEGLYSCLDYYQNVGDLSAKLARVSGRRASFLIAPGLDAVLPYGRRPI